MRRAWTPEEERRLTESWGSVPISRLCRAFGRSKNALFMKARSLGLGGLRDGKYSLQEVSKLTGFGTDALLRLIETYRPVRLKHLGTKKVGHRRFGFTDSDVKKIIDCLGRYAFDGRVFPRRRDGGWGQEGKPSACVNCDRSDLPHFAKGRCERRICRRTAPGYCSNCARPLPHGYDFRTCEECLVKSKLYGARYRAKSRDTLGVDATSC